MAERSPVGLGVVLLLVCFAVAVPYSGPAYAQAGDVRGGGAAPTLGAVGMASATHVLGPGDVVLVQVYLEPEETGSYMVGPTGMVACGPMTGNVMAAGLTLEQLRMAIIDQLHFLIKRPIVQVSLDVERSARRVYVYGEVQEPGVQLLPIGGSITEAVASAGVLPTADLTKVRLTRAGQTPTTLDLEGIRGGEVMPRAVPAVSGDSVYVPKALHRLAFVAGMVANPGPLPLEPDQMDDLTVVSALSIAGGPLPGADLYKGLLMHAQGATETVDLHALLYDGDVTQNLPMEGGDTLLVRPAEQIVVGGEVNQPGRFPIDEPISVLEALAIAGGPSQFGGLRNAKFIPKEGEGVEVDLEAAWWKGDVAQVFDMSPGDMLLIPERDPDEVLVVGQVETPGAADLFRAPNKTILRAVQAAIPLPTADLRRVMLHRTAAGAPITIDMKSIMEEGNLQANLELQAGDTVFVPELGKVYAIGAFINPGVYPLLDNMTLMELVATAGAFRDGAIAKNMRWIRPQAGGPAEVRQINWKRIERGLDPADFTIEEGDIVFVPSRDPNKRSWWDLFRDVTWGIAALSNIFSN